MSNSADHQTHPSGSDEWREKSLNLIELAMNELEELDADDLHRGTKALDKLRRAINTAYAHVLSAPVVQTERVPDAWMVQARMNERLPWRPEHVYEVDTQAIQRADELREAGWVTRVVRVTVQDGAQP